MISRTNAVIGSSGGGGTAGEFMCTVIDYDGTVLKQEFLNTGDTFELPSAPDRTSEGLVFDGWSSPVDIVNNKVTVEDQDINIGAMYYTSSGKVEIDIEVGDNFSYQFGGGFADGNIDWGDGTVDATGAHTYTIGGKYTISLLFKDNYLRKVSLLQEGLNVVKAIRLPNTITTFDYECCYKCYSLETVAMTKGPTTFSARAFNTCPMLKAFVVPSTITSLNTANFGNCSTIKYIVLPSVLTYIDSSSFSSDYNLVSLTIPSGVTRIRESTFSSCYSLRGLNLKNIITMPAYTETNCFNNLDSLKYFVLSNNLTIFPRIASRSLKEITLPNSLTSFGGVSNSYNIKSIDMPDTVTEIESGAFYRDYGLERVKLSNSLSSITNQMFDNCYSLKEINIPNSVTSIGQMAFQYCYGLTNVVIPENVTTLGKTVFGYCYALNSVVINGDITSIGSQAFCNCQCLTKVDLTNCTTVPTLGSTAFNGCNSGLRILVPASLEAEWKAADNWSSYANKIVGV